MYTATVFIFNSRFAIAYHPSHRIAPDLAHFLPTLNGVKSLINIKKRAILAFFISCYLVLLYPWRAYMHGM